MTQRNPMNDRYTGDKKQRGKTRRSPASAKPKAVRAATLTDPKPKTKKEKRQEAKEHEKKVQELADAMSARYEDTPGYKKLRRTWWILLGAAILATVCSVIINSQARPFFDENPGSLFLGILNQQAIETLGAFFMFAAYGCIIAAFYIDFGKIRKERKIHNEALGTMNSKAARRARKQAAAEKRAKGESEGDEPAASSGGFLSKFKKK